MHYAICMHVVHSTGQLYAQKSGCWVLRKLGDFEKSLFLVAKVYRFQNIIKIQYSNGSVNLKDLASPCMRR